jgi:hypothetical protein
MNYLIMQGVHSIVGPIEVGCSKRTGSQSLIDWVITRNGQFAGRERDELRQSQTVFTTGDCGGNRCGLRSSSFDSAAGDNTC